MRVCARCGRRYSPPAVLQRLANSTAEFLDCFILVYRETTFFSTYFSTLFISLYSAWFWSCSCSCSCSVSILISVFVFFFHISACPVRSILFVLHLLFLHFFPLEPAFPFGLLWVHVTCDCSWIPLVENGKLTYIDQSQSIKHSNQSRDNIYFRCIHYTVHFISTPTICHMLSGMCNSPMTILQLDERRWKYHMTMFQAVQKH